MPPNTGVQRCGEQAERPGCDHERQQTEDEANDVIMTGRSAGGLLLSRPRAMERFLSALLGKFNDQNAILGCKSDKDDHADLGVEIERHLPAPSRQMIENADRHDSSTGTGIVQLS